jgi:DNA-binding LytR/AlgR family response regulator
MRGLRVRLREQHGHAIHASWAVNRRWLRRVVLTVLASVFLAVSGGFGSESAAFLPRVGFWVLGIALGAAIGGNIADGCDRHGWPAGAWTHFVFVAVATALPTVVLIWALDELVFLDGQFDVRRLPDLVAPVLVVTLVMSALNTFVGRQPVMTHAISASDGAYEAAPAARAVPRLFDRLPQKLRGGELWAIEAEDHYLRLHTSKGSDLILLRLADAVAELEGIEGAQTHRSWWVARAAVEGARRSDGRATLLLKGGLEAPVSRTYSRALKDAHWF